MGASNEKDFLHDLSNLITKIQGRSLLLKKRSQSLSDKDQQDWTSLNKSMDEIIQLIGKRKNEIRGDS